MYVVSLKPSGHICASSKKVKPSQEPTSTREGDQNDTGSSNHKFSPLLLKWGKSNMNLLPWNLNFLMMSLCNLAS